jgi:hypothetical protein
LFFIIRNYDKELYFSLIKEDAIIENSQFFFYLIAGIVAFFTIYIQRKANLQAKVAYILFAFVMIVFAFEEISWGQRIFNIETPDAIIDINTQNELNFHNLKPVQQILHLGYMVISLYFCLGNIFFKNLIKKLFLEFGYLFNTKKILLWYYLPVFIFYFFYDFFNVQLYGYIGFYILDARDQEVFETLFSLGFMIFAIKNYLITKK